MPSEYTATDESAAWELFRRPTPRSEIRSFCVEYCRPGVKFVMSWIVLIPTRSRRSDEKAEMATGTSCRLCSRFSAVTTSSSMVLVDAAAAAVVAWRDCAWADVTRAVARTSAPDARRRALVCNVTSPAGPLTGPFDDPECQKCRAAGRPAEIAAECTSKAARSGRCRPLPP